MYNNNNSTTGTELYVTKKLLIQITAAGNKTIAMRKQP